MTIPSKQFLAAESFGKFVRLRPGYIGRVVSVHRSAINIACTLGPCAQTCLADHIMVLLTRAPGRVPNGVHLNVAPDGSATNVAFDLCGITVGSAVVQVDDALSIGDQLRVDLTFASPWDGSVTPVEAIEWVTLASHGALLAGRMSHDPMVETRIARFGDVLAHRHCVTDRAQLEAVVSSIMGLGSGSTPTGDDVLLGALALLDAAGDEHATMLRGIVDQIITEMPLVTTGVSLALLRAATARQHAELTGNLVTAVVRGDANDVVRAIPLIEAVGATSGRDTVRGVDIAVRSLLARRAGSTARASLIAS